MNHIVIVEDESSIADVLVYALKTDGYSTTHYPLAQPALQALRNTEAALLILDVGLPDKNGFDVCREIRQFSDIPILFLTARADEIDRIVGLEIGADDYVTKPFSPREVVARVRSILRRRIPSTPPSSNLFAIDEASARIRYCSAALDLTRYEYLLLKTLLEHPGRIYSREFLMDAVWQNALDTSDRTVDTHIKTLRAKLKNINDQHEPITTHRGMGYSVSNS